jgi:hypothetical protein
MAHLSANPPVEYRRKSLSPTPHGRMIHRETVLGDEFLHIAVASGEYRKYQRTHRIIIWSWK